jgi:hypothetical protein
MQEPVLPIILQQDFGYGRQYTGYRYMEYFRIGFLGELLPELTHFYPE